MLSFLNAGNGLGIRVVGGKEIPGTNGEIAAYIARILPGGNAEQTGKLMEGTVISSLSSLVLISMHVERGLSSRENLGRPDE